MRSLRTLIVAVVKICEQCLQTASASRESLDLLPGFTPGPTGGPDTLSYNCQIKIIGATIDHG